MEVTFGIRGISKEKLHHYYGILTSLFDILDDVMLKRCRSTKIIHLFEERLQKSEIKELHILFNVIIKELSEKSQVTRISGNANQSEFTMPEIFLKRFKNFGIGVSTIASGPHQVPKSWDDSKTPEYVKISIKDIVNAK